MAAINLASAANQIWLLTPGAAQTATKQRPSSADGPAAPARRRPTVPPPAERASLIGLPPAGGARRPAFRPPEARQAPCPLDPIDRPDPSTPLQRDGRVTMTNLAAQVGLVRHALVPNSVRRLGAKASSPATTPCESARLGLRVLVFIEIGCPTSRPKVLDEIRQSLGSMRSPNAIWCRGISYPRSRPAWVPWRTIDDCCTLHSYPPGVVMQRSYVVMENGRKPTWRPDPPRSIDGGPA